MPDRLLRGMYRRSSAWLLDELQLVPISAQQDLIGYGPVAAGIAFAANSRFAKPSAGSVVVGGACLTSCNAQLDRLRVEFVADTLQPLLLAAWAQVPCVLFLPIGEEIIVSDPAISPSAWRDFGQQLEGFVRRLAASVPGGQPPVLIRTDKQPVSAALDSAAEAIAELATAERLEFLYSIRPSKASSARPPSRARLRQYRRSLVTYLPTVVSDLVGGSPIEHIVVAENLHQTKAISTARTVLEATGARERLDHLAHIPTPSVSGTGRMARADDHSTVFTLDSAEARSAKLRRMTASVREFWEAVGSDLILPRSTAREQNRARTAFNEWNRLLRDAAAERPLQGKQPSPVQHDTYEGATR